MKKISIAITAIIIAALIIGISAMAVRVKKYSDKLEDVLKNIINTDNSDDSDKTDDNNKDDINDNNDKQPVPSVPTSIKVQSKDVSAVNGAYTLSVGKTYSFEIVQDNENHAVLEEYNAFNIVTTATGLLTVGEYHYYPRDKKEKWLNERQTQLSEFKDDILIYSLTDNILQITLKKTVKDFYKQYRGDSSERIYTDKVKSIDSSNYSFDVYVYNAKLGVSLNCNLKILEGAI